MSINYKYTTSFIIYNESTDLYYTNSVPLNFIADYSFGNNIPASSPNFETKNSFVIYSHLFIYGTETVICISIQHGLDDYNKFVTIYFQMCCSSLKIMYTV